MTKIEIHISSCKQWMLLLDLLVNSGSGILLLALLVNSGAGILLLDHPQKMTYMYTAAT